MKKSFIFASLLFTLSFAFAQFQSDDKQIQKGGFTGPSSSVATVERAKKLRDDSNVILEGKITQHIGKDKYIFQDSSGDITIEIDNDDWNGVVVNPSDTVVIYGEVDKDWNSVEIDIDKVVKK